MVSLLNESNNRSAHSPPYIVRFDSFNSETTKINYQFLNVSPSNSLLTVPRRWFCHCGSLLPVFGVRVSVTFHFTCVHIIFSSAWVVEWPPFAGEIAAHSVDHMFSLHFDFL